MLCSSLHLHKISVHIFSVQLTPIHPRTLLFPSFPPQDIGGYDIQKQEM
jgi:hypothetical protein